VKKLLIGYIVSAVLSALFGILVTGLGIYLLVKGQDCLSYNDYGCAFGTMFSFIIIPYGIAILFFIGLTSVPFRAAQLIGSVFSVLLGFINMGLCCITTTWIFSSDGASLLSNEVISFIVFPLVIFLGGIALMGTGIVGYQRAKQMKPIVK